MTPQLYIGTNGMSVWRSKDLGDTIIRVPTDLGIYVGTQIWALARHDAAPEALLAGTNTGVIGWTRQPTLGAMRPRQWTTAWRSPP